MIKRQLIGLSDQAHMTEAHEFGIHAVPDSYTMIGYTRLANIELLINDVIENKIDGHLIETGVWMGGACIYMKYLLNQHGSKKKVFVADSFKGLPEPDPKYTHDEGDTHHQVTFLRVSKERVQENFKAFGLLDKRVKFIEGWFKHTLPHLNERFCIIRLDGDMYESTMDALKNLYHKLNVGGYVIIDEYLLLHNCCAAVDAFRKANGITDEMIRIDKSGVYWKKTA